MDLENLINETADRADDILKGISIRKDARKALAESLAAEHPQLEVDERSIVVAGVMRILDNEDFFAASPTETETVWGDGPVDEPEA